MTHTTIINKVFPSGITSHYEAITGANDSLRPASLHASHITESFTVKDRRGAPPILHVTLVMGVGLHDVWVAFCVFLSG